jgi:hypothetical protein
VALAREREHQVADLVPQFVLEHVDDPGGEHRVKDPAVLHVHRRVDSDRDGGHRQACSEDSFGGEQRRVPMRELDRLGAGEHPGAVL